MMRRIAPYLLLLIYAWFCYLMAGITWQYVPLDLDVAFLRIKQSYISLPHYQWAFFLHVYSAMLVLPAGFTQFSTWIRKQHPWLHRGSGWIYASVSVLLAGPSGLIIGWYANGGWSSQLAFCLLAILWMTFSWMAIWRIRQGDVEAHKRWMYRSFALALSAITLRAWKFLIVAFFEPRPMDVYRIVAWLGWVLNLLIAEWLILRTKQLKKKTSIMKWYLPFCLLLVLWACNESPSEPTNDNNQVVEEINVEQTDIEEKEVVETSVDTTTTEQEVEGNPTEQLLGYYVGEFEAIQYDTRQSYVYYNKINISIDSIAGDSLYGHSVVAGNDRPFQGSIRKSSKIYIVEVREPGDDRYDGIFNFTIAPEQSRMKGTWDAYNPKLAVSKRAYDLNKRRFAYNPNLALPEDVQWAELSAHTEEVPEEGEFITEDVLKFNPSTTLLLKEDVENMYRGDLEIIRNSIYARHGYSFKNRKMRFIFDKYIDWYIPVSTDIRHLLTEVEKKNIDLLKRYERHAERYYDTFGR
ncbi:MAG: DUF2306 domain-containing protein [Bacteroidota bacterium]